MIKHILLYLFVMSSFVMQNLMAQDAGIKAKRLPATINKPDTDELCPVISPDGNTLYFVKGYNEHGDNDAPVVKKKKRIGQEIWYSTKDASGEWTEAKQLTALNNKYHNVICGISDDGNKLYISNVYLKIKANDTLMHRGISYVEKKDGNWSSVTEFEIEDFKDVKFDGASHFHFFVEPKNEAYIVMSKHESVGTKGEEDLYVSEKNKDGKYSAPQSLGNVINSEGFETSPFISADGNTLFFASNRGGGNPEDRKASHIYFATRKDKKNWTNWSKPELLEKYNPDWKEVNNDHFDAYLYLHADPNDKIIDFGYFVSDRDGGRADIYQLDVNYHLKINVFACGKDGKNTPLSAKEFQLTNKPDLKPITNNNNQNFLYDLKKSDFGNYNVSVSADEYISKDTTFSISAADFSNGKFTTERNICLNKVIVPELSKLDSALATVYFEFDKASMDSTAVYRKIKEGQENLVDASVLLKRGGGKNTIIDMVKKIKDSNGELFKIVLVGRADSIGTVSRNVWLSQRRIDSVKVFLENELKKEGLEYISVEKQEVALGEEEHIKDKFGRISNEARRLNRSVRIEGYIRKISAKNSN